MTNFKIQISINVIYHLLYDDTIICGCLSTKSEAFNRTLIDWGLIQALNGNQKLEIHCEVKVIPPTRASLP